MSKALALALLSLTIATAAPAQTAGDYQVPRITAPPKMDGVLDDEAWQAAPLPVEPDQWVSYSPVRGDKMPAGYRTDVRIAFDDRNIYVAFHCFDNEPDKIRTNVSRRDSAFNDDWIALSLDSAANGQSAYHLFANPSGSQMDAINTSASGEQFDADLVWYSVGKTTGDGYVVEVQIPLQTLRFKASDQVRMNLVFFRKISRTGVSYAWPEMLPGQWVFDRPSHIAFANLKPRRLVELLPAVTYGVNQARDETSSAWAEAEGKAHVGASGKLGITSNITLDGTVNPDFSQVESDQFQITVNQRYPLFFSEKRPFFMEGMGLFNVAHGNNMRTAVHTRRIVDPIFGAKLTGTTGKTTFGVLSANDDHPGDVGDRGDAFADRNKLFTIGRATYALRRSDYIGAIFTQTRHAGRGNLAGGADLSIRPSSAQLVSASFLATRTSDSGNGDTSGNAGHVFYNYETRRLQTNWQVEHYDRDFQMDTAFYRRTGFTAGSTYNEINFYPGQAHWVQKISPFLFASAGRDRIQDGDERFLNTGFRFNFTRQGNFNLETSRGKEAWQGRQFDVGAEIFVFAGMQVVRWLNVFGGGGAGPSIYYDEVDPFQGYSKFSFFGLTFQPNQHLTQSIEGNTERFDRASTSERIYSVNIINSRTTYQFDKHFLVRMLLQYDSSEHRVLTDLLASYEFVPGTVFHAGYGSLLERGPVGAMPRDANSPVRLDEQYRAVNRGLFFKASYLKRF